MEWPRLTSRYALLKSLEDRRQIVGVDIGQTFREVRGRGFAGEAQYPEEFDGARPGAAGGIDDPAAGSGETLRIVEHPASESQLVSQTRHLDVRVHVIGKRLRRSRGLNVNAHAESIT